MDYQKKNSSTSQESTVQNKTDIPKTSVSIPRVAIGNSNGILSIKI